MNDVPVDCLSLEEVFANAPDREGDFFRIPGGSGTYSDNFTTVDAEDIKTQVKEFEARLKEFDERTSSTED